MDVRDGSFKLKVARINMVHQSPFCGKASEDANAHLQHFLEICRTFTIRGVTQDAVCLRIFLFSLLGKEKQCFYSNKEAIVNLGEMLQCISHQVFSVGQDQCPSEQDLYLSITRG
jgi:hypothetical protein